MAVTSAAEASHGSAAVGEDNVVDDDGECHHLHDGATAVDVDGLHRHSQLPRVQRASSLARSFFLASCCTFLSLHSHPILRR